jgi:preprotein translocase subunit SecE
LRKWEGTGRATGTRAGEDGGLSMKNPLQFIEEVRQETAKVTWPTWKEVWITTIMVLIMVTLTSIFFLLADMVISRVIKLVLGLGQ